MRTGMDCDGHGLRRACVAALTRDHMVAEAAATSGVQSSMQLAEPWITPSSESLRPMSKTVSPDDRASGKPNWSDEAIVDDGFTMVEGRGSCWRFRGDSEIVLESVPEAVDRNELAGLARHGFQLPADVAHVDAQQVGTGRVGVSPYRRGEHAMRDQAPFVADQVLDDLPFGGGEMHLALVGCADLSVAPYEVELDPGRGHLEEVEARMVVPAEQDTYTSEKLRHMERLCHAVVRSGVESCHPVALIVLRCQGEDWDVGPATDRREHL